MDKEVATLSEFYDIAIAVAHDMGMQPFPVEFHIVPSERIYEISSYLLPVNVSHWTYGKRYWQQKQQYEQGSGRLYEVVINANPAIAYLLDGNTIAAQKLVIAHVLGHSDVFANHDFFVKTRHPDVMSALEGGQRRIAEYEEEFGEDAVEYILDCALTLQWNTTPLEVATKTMPTTGIAMQDDELADLFPQKTRKKVYRKPRFTLPTADILGFLAENSPVLQDWERDICKIVQTTGHILWPQTRTKIINEGLATYAHRHITQDARLPITDGEHVTMAKMHSAITQPWPTSINPYNFGWMMIEWLAQEYTWPVARQIVMRNSDSSLIRNFLTNDAIRFLDLYLYEWVEDIERKSGRTPQGVENAKRRETDPDDLRDAIANSLGVRDPVVVVNDVDSDNTLYLIHEDAKESLDQNEAVRASNAVALLWGSQVVLTDHSTMINAKPKHPFFRKRE